MGISGLELNKGRLITKFKIFNGKCLKVLKNLNSKDQFNFLICVYKEFKFFKEEFIYFKKREKNFEKEIKFLKKENEVLKKWKVLVEIFDLN